MANKMMTLKEATKNAPKGMGCYKLFIGDQLVYVGKAEDGLRKRFVQYYNGTTDSYTSGATINLWKDQVTVKYEVFTSKKMVRKCESEWIKEYSPILNKQSGWGEVSNYKGISAGTLTTAEKVMSPEMAIAGCMGKAVAAGVSSAVGLTAATEVVKSVVKKDDPVECIGNIASRSCEAAVSSGAAALAGEVAGFAAVAAGLGPVGMGVATAAAAVAVGAVASEVVSDKFNDVKYFVKGMFYWL